MMEIKVWSHNRYGNNTGWKAILFLSVQDNADPHEDPFEKAREQKRERVAKNELQRLRNIARSVCVASE